MDVVITGLGCITAVGRGQEQVKEALFAGVSGVGTVERFDTGKISTRKGYEIKTPLPAMQRQTTRLVQLGFLAAKEAVADSGLRDMTDVCLLAGSGLGDEECILQSHSTQSGRTGWLNNDHRLGPQIGALLGIKGGVIGNGTACAAALASVAYGAELIKNSEYETVVVGGAETFSINSMAYFDRVTTGPSPEMVQPFDKNRKGMLLGEGAGFLVLEGKETAVARRKKMYGEILGYAMSSDAFHISNMCQQGVTRAISGALHSAGAQAAEIDYIAAHGTGTRINDAIESQAVKHVYGSHAYQTPISSIKSMIGHTGGASGAIGVISALFVIENQSLIPTINYQTPDPQCDLDYVSGKQRQCLVDKAQVNGFGFGGANCSMVIGAVSVP